MHTLNKVIGYIQSKLVDVADTGFPIYILKSLSTCLWQIYYTFFLHPVSELNSTGWAKGVETSLTLDAEAHPHAASSHM